MIQITLVPTLYRPECIYLILLLSGVPYEIRTRVCSVKGSRPRPLDEGDSENYSGCARV